MHHVQQWMVGSLANESFANIAKGTMLRWTREQIYNAKSAKIGRYDRHSSLARHGGTCAPSFERDLCAPGFAREVRVSGQRPVTIAAAPVRGSGSQSVGSWKSAAVGDWSTNGVIKS